MIQKPKMILYLHNQMYNYSNFFVSKKIMTYRQKMRTVLNRQINVLFIDKFYIWILLLVYKTFIFEFILNFFKINSLLWYKDKCCTCSRVCFTSYEKENTVLQTHRVAHLSNLKTLLYVPHVYLYFICMAFIFLLIHLDVYFLDLIDCV